jgi:glutamate carboxypeptidase
MYGPGVTDCKGGIIVGLLAMAALDDLGFRDRPVRMLLQTDEEKGSTPSGKKTIRHICETAKDSKAFFNLEGNGNGEGVIVTTKGIARYLLTVHGKAAHSSRRQQGASAILEAAHKIVALENESDPEGKETTYNCGVVKGGTVANSVAAECEVIVDVRYATQAAGLAADAFVRKVAAHSTVAGCTCDVALISDRPATELCEKNLSLLADANAIFAAEGLPVLGQKNGMGGTDMAYVTQYGIPCMDSIGVEGTHVHSVNERMVLASLAESAKRIAAIVYCIEGDSVR